MPKNNQTFSERVKAVVRCIPRGKTLSYKEVAELAGAPRAHRAVARVMSQNTDASVPCHRVIRSDGKLGGYNIAIRAYESLSDELVDILNKISYTIHSNRPGEDIKQRILQEEGVVLK